MQSCCRVGAGLLTGLCRARGFSSLAVVVAGKGEQRSFLCPSAHHCEANKLKAAVCPGLNCQSKMRVVVKKCPHFNS